MKYFIDVSKTSKKERIFYLDRKRKFKSLRRKLKKIFGIALFRYPNEKMDHVKDIIELIKPKKIITIGDFVTRSFIENKINVNFAIIDGYLENKKLDEKIDVSTFNRVLRIKNPKGTLSLDNYLKVKEELVKDNCIILVDGEEDLLAIVPLIEENDNSLVIFGLPNFGIEIVIVNKRKRFILRKMIQRMF